MNEIEQMISRLEHQGAAIERAIKSLREIEGGSARTGSASARAQTVRRKRSATQQASAPGSNEPAKQPKRGLLTAAGRKKLSLAAKKRWALAKRKGLNAITGKPLSKTT